jgi:hypothetical protein
MKKKFFILLAFLTFCGSMAAQDRVAFYNGPGNGLDQSRAICMDSSGNVYITGNSYGGSSTDMDYCTIKYSKYNQREFIPRMVWVARFNGTGSFTDQANAIACDNLGNVYVTGWAHMEPGGLDCGTIDYVTIKYNSNGVQQWMQRYNGPGNSTDMANAIAVDAQGNVYVTGSSIGVNTSEDIATIKYNTNGVQQWVTRYNGTSNGSDVGRAIGVDASGNVYVTGNSFKTGQGSDYITIKYNSSGVQQWAARYNGPGNGNDTAFALVIDKRGNVIVTGEAKGLSSNLDYTTIQYDPNGNVLYLDIYNGPGNGIDEARSIARDFFDNVYVTGYSMGTGTGYDYATIMYNPIGDMMWVQRYNGPANLNDKAWAVTVSTLQPKSNEPYFIYVTGQSQYNATLNDYLTIKYDIYGDTIWTKRYHYPTSNVDAVPSSIVAKDNLSLVYVTGTVNSDYATVMYYSVSQTPSEVEKNDIGNKLLQNRPNPFNPSTVIGYNLTSDAYVTLKIYDVLGREVANLVDGKLEAGSFEVSWNASDFPSGAYFYTITADGVKIDTKRMLLIK